MSKLRGSTKVGALVLGPGFEIRSTGWNGAPRGSQADVDDRGLTRDDRLKWAVHAEANAIAQAARVGTPLDGCTMVVTHPPCTVCARFIIQAGILRVVTEAPSENFLQKWSEDLARTERMFKECGVELITIDTTGVNA